MEFNHGKRSVLRELGEIVRKKEDPLWNFVPTELQKETMLTLRERHSGQYKEWGSFYMSYREVKVALTRKGVELTCDMDTGIDVLIDKGLVHGNISIPDMQFLKIGSFGLEYLKRRGL